MTNLTAGYALLGLLTVMAFAVALRMLFSTRTEYFRQEMFALRRELFLFMVHGGVSSRRSSTCFDRAAQRISPVRRTLYVAADALPQQPPRCTGPLEVPRPMGGPYQGSHPEVQATLHTIRDRSRRAILHYVLTSSLASLLLALPCVAIGMAQRAWRRPGSPTNLRNPRKRPLLAHRISRAHEHELAGPLRCGRLAGVSVSPPRP